MRKQPTSANLPTWHTHRHDLWKRRPPSVQADRCDFSSERFGQRFIVADFNNDQKPDSITLMSLGAEAKMSLVCVCALLGGL